MTEVLAGNLDKAPGLQERQAVFGLVDELLDFLSQLGQLLADLEVGDHALLVGDLDRVVLLLQLLYSCAAGERKPFLGEKKSHASRTFSRRSASLLSTTPGRAR